MSQTDYLTNRILTEDTVYVQYRKTAKAPNIAQPHTHGGYEIYYFQHGEATYIIGDKVYALKPGDMLLFRGEIVHLVKPSERVPYLRSILNFREDVSDSLDTLLQEKLAKLFGASGGQIIHWTEEERGQIEHLFFSIAQEARRREVGYQDMMHALWAVLVLRIMRKYEADVVRNRILYGNGQREANIERTLHILNQKFRNRVSLEDVAEQVHLNKHYLCHCFKQVTGLTINQYVTKLRVDEGKRLLLHTNKPVVVIAEEVGAGTAAQFSRMFRQQVGVSPNAYRRGFHVD
ncbi:hypothetical protein AAC03nite_36470 [Alicyclobacillus acidoterrestris]|uniref:AraC family transcriptional regulator n=1 Tax=Alicyclobacillus suci TaxID=2816080 RepID=UPI00119652DF|nr:AraC family transcriptional regulator [Alicyclobacillus suci]GEO27862.1 hypothetical protein AAC03nite_36470 [Alicyclobacillus acidoterrestris]